MGDIDIQERMNVQRQAIAEYGSLVTKMNEHIAELHEDNAVLRQELNITVDVLQQVFAYLKEEQKEEALKTVRNYFNWIDEGEQE